MNKTQLILWLHKIVEEVFNGKHVEEIRWADNLSLENECLGGYFVIHYHDHHPCQVDVFGEDQGDGFEFSFESELYCVWKERDPLTGEEFDSDFDPELPDRVYDHMSEFQGNTSLVYTIDPKTLEVKKNEKS